MDKKHLENALAYAKERDFYNFKKEIKAYLYPLMKEKVKDIIYDTRKNLINIVNGGYDEF